MKLLVKLGKISIERMKKLLDWLEISPLGETELVIEGDLYLYVEEKGVTETK